MPTVCVFMINLAELASSEVCKLSSVENSWSPLFVFEYCNFLFQKIYCIEIKYGSDWVSNVTTVVYGYF